MRPPLPRWIWITLAAVVAAALVAGVVLALVGLVIHFAGTGAVLEVRTATPAQPTTKI